MLGRIRAWKLVLLAGLFLAAVSGFAQLDTGAISGSVTDSSGAAIAGASITIRDLGTGSTRTLQSNAAGRYEAGALAVGNYEVRATLAGFQTMVRSGVTLTVGLNAVIDLTLQVGDVQQAVTVTGEASQVETTTATVSNLVDEKQVSNIPLNDRDLTQLAFMQSGILKVPLVAGLNANSTYISGMGDKLSVAGGRGSQNIYLVDGVSNSDISGNAQGAAGNLSGAETVKEFQIITNNYSAEYPSKPGAIISMVTKSGTNAFHGSLFEFLRNSDLDARKWETNAFANGLKPAFKRNQFGGSFGGPIKKDRFFFFVSYEGLRERNGTTATAIIPSAGAHTGNLGTGGTVAVSPSVVPYLNLYPIAGQAGTNFLTDFGDGRVQVSGTQQIPINDDYGTGKADYQFASQRKGFLAFTYNFDNSSLSNIPFLLNTGPSGVISTKRLYAGHLTSILSPTALNEVAVGFTRVAPLGNIPLGSGVDYSNVGGLNLLFKPDAETLGGISPGNSVASLGHAPGETVFGVHQLTAKESMSLTRGKQTLKFGVEIDHLQDPIIDNTTFTNGSFTFSNLGLFLQGKPNNYSVDLPKGALVFGLPAQQVHDYNVAQYIYGFYFQDNYQIRPSLTLNLGMRYEFMTLPVEANGRLGSVRSIFATTVTIGEPMTNPTLHDFSPRFGFAWSPGDHKTSVRGGFGIYYDMPTLFAWRYNMTSMPPFLIEGSATDSASAGLINFPNAFTTQPALLAATPNLRSAQYAEKPTYIYRESLTIEREIGSWLFSAGFTGSRALHLWVVSEANISRWVGWPNNVPSGAKQFSAALGNINPALGRYTVQAPWGNNLYNGLVVSVMRRLTKGLQFQASYTYSKSIGEAASNTNNEEGLAQGQRGFYYWDQGMEKGLSPLDIRNNFVTNLTYNVPNFGHKGVVGAVANGWQFSGVLTLSAGYPFSIMDNNTAQNTAFFDVAALRVNLIPGGNNNPVLGTPNQWYDPTQFVPSTCTGSAVCKAGDPTYRTGYFGDIGYNTVIAPGLTSFDFSTIKNMKITETKQLQFRAEFFNLTNSPNFALPNATPFLSNGTRDPTAGQITLTRGSSRQIQFALKFMF